MERSSSTFPETHILFVLNILGLAETVLTWGAKVVAAAATPAADAAEKNWKHKVTLDWGYLIIDGKQVQVKLLSKTMNTPIMNTICVIQLSLRQTPADNNI